MQAYKLLIALKLELLNEKLPQATKSIINRNLGSIEKQLTHLLEHRQA